MTLREALLAGGVMLFGFGVLYRATEPMRQRKVTSHCASNAKMIGLGVMQYAQDNDEILPRAWYGRDAGPSDPKTNYKWMDAIYPFVKDPKYFVCPLDSSKPPYRYRSGVNYGSYLYNNAYLAPGDRFTPPAGKSLAVIADTMTVLVMEGENDFRFAWDRVADAPGEQPDRLCKITVRHHGDFSRVPMTAWVGGLVQSYPLRQVLAARPINGQTVYTGLTIESDSR